MLLSSSVNTSLQPSASSRGWTTSRTKRKTCGSRGSMKFWPRGASAGVRRTVVSVSIRYARSRVRAIVLDTSVTLHVVQILLPSLVHLEVADRQAARWGREVRGETDTDVGQHLHVI